MLKFEQKSSILRNKSITNILINAGFTMGNQKLPELLFKRLSKTIHKTKKAISVPFYPDMGKKEFYQKTELRQFLQIRNS